MLFYSILKGFPKRHEKQAEILTMTNVITMLEELAILFFYWKGFLIQIMECVLK